MDRTGSGSFRTSGFGVPGIAPSGYATTVLVRFSNPHNVNSVIYGAFEAVLTYRHLSYPVIFPRVFIRKQLHTFASSLSVVLCLPSVS